MPPISKVGHTLRRTITLMAVVLLALIGISATATTARADADEIKKAVVHLQQDLKATVRYTFQDGTTKDFSVEKSFTCSGFFVGPSGEIATAGHCVDKSTTATDIYVKWVQDLELSEADAATALQSAQIVGGDDNVQMSVWAYQPDELKGVLDYDGLEVSVENYKTPEQGDHAYLKLNNLSVETPYLRLASKRPEIGEDIVAIGFPGSVSASTDQTRQSASFKDGKVSSHQTENGVSFTEVSAAMSGGMSGGPVVNANEEVVGVVSWGPIDEPQAINFMTDTDGMRSFLKSSGVDVESSAPASSSSNEPVALPDEDTGTESSSGSLFLIGAVVLVLAAGAVVFFVVRNNNKKNAAALTAARQGNPPPQQPWQPNPQQGQQSPQQGWSQQGPPPQQPGQQPSQNWQGGQPPQNQPPAG